MHSSSFFDATRIIGIILDLVIVVFALRSASRWWSLVAYCGSHLVFTAAMLPYTPDTYRYFYLYWASQAVSATIRLWILHDVICSFPGSVAFRRELWIFTVVAGGSMAVLSWLLCHRSSPYLAMIVKRTVVDLQVSISIAWGAFYAVALIAIAAQQLKWSRRGAIVSNGLIVSTIATYSVGLLSSGSQKAAGQFILVLSSLVTLTTWAYALSRKEEVYELPQTVIEALKRRLSLPNEASFPREL